MNKTRIILALVLVGLGALAFWWFNRPGDRNELLLYGNVDLRQAELAFNNSERIATVLVQEGDHVHRGQVLAELDARRLEAQVAQVQAQVEAQRQALERLRNGSRPEEITQARANVDSSQADLSNAQRQYNRLKGLNRAAVSQEDLDNAQAAVDVATAKLTVTQKALELQVAGPRKEDIAQAQATLQASQAQLEFLSQQLSDAQLLAPLDGVIRSRLMEPGEMANPQKPVFSLAIIDPKWVRAYVSEPELGKVRQGMRAIVSVDSFPNRRFQGWIGFISPMAEFTPKAVQTNELRTSLVYEVRVFVTDPDDQLRLGMPATVHLEPDKGDITSATMPATQVAPSLPGASGQR